MFVWVSCLPFVVCFDVLILFVFALQADVRKAMRMFEDATKLVSLVDMFSANESYEEVSTENLKYFLLPALLGTLATKLCNIEDRMQVVDIAEIYFVDYLKRLKDYGLIDIDIPEVKTEESSQQVATVEHEKSNAELITEMVNFAKMFVLFLFTFFLCFCLYSLKPILFCKNLRFVYFFPLFLFVFTKKMV